MRLERHVGLLVGLVVLIVVLLTPAVMFRSGTWTGHLRSAGAQPASETRQRVHLTSPERDKILVEMRTMLRSLSEIMQGLVANDLVKAEKASSMSQVGPVVDPVLEQKLPPDYLQLVMRTRKRFGGLADAIKAGATRDAVLRRLAAVTATCVTCHDTYRLDEARE